VTQRALYDTLDTSGHSLSSLCRVPFDAFLTAGLVDAHHALVVVIVVSASTVLGFSMSVPPAESAVGLFAIPRFTGIIGSGVVAAASMLISKAFGLAHCGGIKTGRVVDVEKSVRGEVRDEGLGKWAVDGPGTGELSNVTGARQVRCGTRSRSYDTCVL